MAPPPRQPPSSNQPSLMDAADDSSVETPAAADGEKTPTAAPRGPRGKPKGKPEAAASDAAPKTAAPKPEPAKGEDEAPAPADQEQAAEDLGLESVSRGERTYPVVVRGGQRSVVAAEAESEDEEDELVALRTVDPDDEDDDEADTIFAGVYEALRRPFSIDAMRWRPRGKDGTMLPYIEGSSVLGRLNAVIPGNWRDQFVEAPSFGVSVNVRAVICRLTILGVTREDLGAADVFYKRNGEMVVSDTSLKRVVTDARKRAAALFGIGEYLPLLPPFHVERVHGLVGTGGGGVQLTEQGYSSLREQYATWLRDGGMDTWGEPIDHGETRFVPPPVKAKDDVDDEDAEEAPRPRRARQQHQAPPADPPAAPQLAAVPTPPADDQDNDAAIAPSVLQRIIAGLEDRGFTDHDPKSAELFAQADLPWRNGLVESIFDPDLRRGEAVRLYAAIGAYDEATGYTPESPPPASDDDIKF